jgi:hypothetical protein
MSGSRNFNPQIVQDLVLPWLGCRDIAPQVLSDGATANRRLEATPGSPGAIAGLPATFWVKRLYVPTSNPSATARIFDLTASGTNPTASANRLAFILDTSGAATLSQVGTTVGIDYRSLVHASFRSTYSGQWVQLVVSFPTGDSTTNPTIWCNGVDISASFSSSTAGTVPNWMPTTLDTTKFLVGYNWPAGDVPEVEYGPGAWTAADALTAAQTGLAPTWWRLGTGSAVSTITGDNRNFDTSLGNWAAVGSGASVTYDAANKELDVTPSAAGKGANLIFATAGYTAFIVGRRYRATFQLANITAGAVRLQIGGSNQVVTDVAADGTYSVDFDITASGASGMMFLQKDAVANTFSLKVVELRPLGPLAKWEIQPVATCYDAGGNKIPLVLTAGITPITRRRDWIIQAKTVTNGNEQLLGAAPFFDHTRYVIDDWVVNNKGSNTRTISLGQASAGTQFLNGGSAPVGRNVITLASKVPGANALWCASDGTDELRHTVRGHIVD